MNTKFVENVESLDPQFTYRWGRLYYGLAYGIHPRVVVETGVYKAYTTAWIAAACSDIGAKFYAIDNWSYSAATLEGARDNLTACGVMDGVELISGDALVEMRRLDERGLLEGLGLVFIDDHHEGEHVRREIEFCWPRLTVGGAIVLHDCLCPDFPDLHNTILDFAEEAKITPIWFPNDRGVVMLQKMSYPARLFFGDVNTAPDGSPPLRCA